MPNTHSILTLTPRLNNKTVDWLGNSSLRAESPTYHIEAIHLQQKQDGFYLKLDDHWVYLKDGDQLQLPEAPRLIINLVTEPDHFEPTPLSNLLAENDWKQNLNDKPSTALNDDAWSLDPLDHHQAPAPVDILDEYLQEPLAPEPWISKKVPQAPTTPFMQKIKKIATTIWE